MRIKQFKNTKGPLNVGDEFISVKKKYTVVRYELDVHNTPIMRATDGKKDSFFYEEDLNARPEA